MTKRGAAAARASRDVVIVPSKRRRRSRTLRAACSACSTVHTTTNPSSWGFKRARTAVSRSTPPLHGRRPPIIKWYVRRRDWANISEGPAGLIAERVLANDVADYIRFRAVCRPWRLCCTGPRGHGSLDRRFHPRHWIMLREELAGPPHHRRFLNISTGECIQTDLSEELHDHDVLGLTTECLLVLLHRRTSIRLLNPLTRHLTELPPLTTLLPQRHSDRRLLSNNNTYFHEDFNAWGSGFTDDSTTFVLCFRSLYVLGITKPGDTRWTLVEYQSSVRTAPLIFAGRFYCITGDGVMVLRTSSAAADEQQQPPRLELVAKRRLKLSGMLMDSAHLVDNGGELMLVHRNLGKRRNIAKRCYDVYKVDLDNGKLSPVRSLGGRALFLGLFCSLSVPAAGVFPSISSDTIYPSFDLWERVHAEQIESYHIRDRTTKPAYYNLDSSAPRPHKVVPGPHTIVDCLSLCNTVRLHDKHLVASII